MLCCCFVRAFTKEYSTKYRAFTEGYSAKYRTFTEGYSAKYRAFTGQYEAYAYAVRSYYIRFWCSLTRRSLPRLPARSLPPRARAPSALALVGRACSAPPAAGRFRPLRNNPRTGHKRRAADGCFSFASRPTKSRLRLRPGPPVR